MAEKQNIDIIAFVGLSGSGKTAASEYVAVRGIPRVVFESMSEVVSQIQHLVQAGQHRIIVDGIDGWESYITLKHQFPGSVTTVALLADRHIRVKRLASRPTAPLTDSEVFAKDNNEVSNFNVGGVIAMADFFLVGSHTLDQLHSQIDDVLEKVDFFKD